MSGMRVDPGALRGLADSADGLAGELAALDSITVEAGAATVGTEALAAAITEFNQAWRLRTTELRAELVDAAEFLRVFADTSEELDAQIAGTSD